MQKRHFHQETTTNIVTGFTGVGPILFACGPTSAEVPPREPGALRSEAYLVVTGVVRSIKTDVVGDMSGGQNR
jgi:hypothetical protein